MSHHWLEDQRADMKAKFIAGLKEWGQAEAAMLNLDVALSTLYRWRDDDPQFKEDWLNATPHFRGRVRRQFIKSAFGKEDANGNVIAPPDSASLRQLDKATNKEDYATVTPGIQPGQYHLMVPMAAVLMLPSEPDAIEAQVREVPDDE